MLKVVTSAHADVREVTLASFGYWQRHSPGNSTVHQDRKEFSESRIKAEIICALCCCDYIASGGQAAELKSSLGYVYRNAVPPRGFTKILCVL